MIIGLLESNKVYYRIQMLGPYAIPTIIFWVSAYPWVYALLGTCKNRDLEIVHFCRAHMEKKSQVRVQWKS